jgi:putative membrane protein
MPKWFTISALAVIVVSAIRPLAMEAWLLENILVLAGALALLLTARHVTLCNVTYVCLLGFLILHEYGAHYYYTGSPLGEWMQGAFSFSRNHYDRIAHFGFGLLLAFPAQDLYEKTCSRTNPWRWVIPFLAMMTCGAMYELFEVGAVLIAGKSELADNFLGMQGDPWDAQIDMGLAGLGAILATAFVYARRSRL